MGFPAILSTLLPFQMWIYNRQYSKWTFSNDSHLIGNKFMANLHASLESTCKSRISKIATRCQNWGSIIFHYVKAKYELKNFMWDPDPMGGQSSFNFWCWSQKCKFCTDIFHGCPEILSTLQPFQMCIYNRQYSKWTFSNDSHLIGNRFMANLHASLESTCKSRISKIATRCQNWGVNHLSLCQG